MKKIASPGGSKRAVSALFHIERPSSSEAGYHSTEYEELWDLGDEQRDGSTRLQLNVVLSCSIFKDHTFINGQKRKVLGVTLPVCPSCILPEFFSHCCIVYS
jgi:hypothetical protein